MNSGKIIKLISNDYTVLCDNKLYVCKARGKFRNINLKPVVGDNVIFDSEKKYILEIEKRKNELIRPLVSNIDQAIIVTSCKEPLFSSNLLDKLLCIIEFSNIKPIIIFTKLDLLNKEELKNIESIIRYYKKIGYEVYKNTDNIKDIFKNKISVFTGQSGAGKSTLLNKLDKNLNLKTNEISHALGRGKHTTRHVELIPFNSGYIADTPGFSSISFSNMTKEEIRNCFIEFKTDNCEYRDCMHDLESNCDIKDKVKNSTILNSRYENYIKFLNEK